VLHSNTQNKTKAFFYILQALTNSTPLTHQYLTQFKFKTLGKYITFFNFLREKTTPIAWTQLNTKLPSPSSIQKMERRDIQQHKTEKKKKKA